ncbi:MAG: hypothetical protein LC620_08165 [Halobacteriales archaeon]|nr:hypothetical protein [Halobacteriales archaeon]
MNGQQRRQALQSLVGDIRERRFPYQERPPPITDWARYDEAQIHETSDVLHLIRALVDVAGGRVRARTVPRPGQPAVPACDLVKVLIAQSYFGHANRPAEGLGELFRERLGLGPRRVAYKTIERAYDRSDVARLLDEVFLLTNEPVRGLERVFSGDGSGASLRVGTHYARTRSRTRGNGVTSDALSGSPGEYAYHFMFIGVKYKVLAGWAGVASVGPGRGEHSLFLDAIQDLPRMGHHVDQVLADAALATRPCCQAVAELGGEPRFLPRRNSTFKSHGVDAWVHMLADLLDHPQEWLYDYHLRSNSESGNSVINRANPQPLRKKLDARIQTEDFLRGIAYNVKRLAYLAYLAQIHPLPDA